MNNVIPRAVSMAVAIGIGLTGAAFGQVPVVEFGIQGPGPGVLAGIYTDPYQGYVGGTVGGNYTTPPPGSTPIAAFCDDFLNDVTPPQYWAAFDTDLSAFNATNASPVSSVYYGAYSPTLLTPTQQTIDYIAVAWLADQSLLAQKNNNLVAQEQISYALWDIFDPSLLNSDCWQPGYCLDTAGQTNLTAAKNYVSSALSVGSTYATLNPTNAGAAFENDFGVTVQIYTPVTYTNGNPVVSQSSSRPQEFVTVASLPTNGVPVSMPEPSAWAALGFNLLGVSVIGFVYRRRQQRQNQ